MDSSLSYGSHLWGCVRAVEDQSEESRAFLKRLQQFVRDKAELDHHYAKQLRKLTDKLHIADQPADGKTLEMFLSSFKEAVHNIAQSFDSAAQKADDDIVRPLQTYMDQHKKQGKQLEDDMSKTQKAYSQHQDALNSAQAACRRACDELLRAKENPPPPAAVTSPTGQAATLASPSATALTSPSTTSSSPAVSSAPSTSSADNAGDALDALATAELPEQQKKGRFNLFKKDTGKIFRSLGSSMSSQMHTMTSSVQSAAQLTVSKPDLNTLSDKAIAADTKYINAVKSMRSYRPQHDQTMAHLLDSYQQLEEERRHTTVDTMATWLSSQSQLLSAGVQVVKDVSAVLGKVSPTRDVLIFVRDNKSEGKAPPLPVYEMMKVASHITRTPCRQLLHSMQPVSARRSPCLVCSLVRVSQGHPQFVEGFDDAQGTGRSDDELAPSEDGALVRKRTNKDVEEERTYQRIMAEQVLSLFVDKVTGRAEALKEREAERKANPDMEDTPESSDMLPDEKSRALDEEEKKVARRLFSTPEGRGAFATVINLLRNRGQLHLSHTAFERLSQLILLFLDQAREAMHVAPIQLVMILSQSLWRDAESSTTSPPTATTASTAPSSNPLSPSNSSSSLSSQRAVAPKKVFLSTLVNSHPVWTDDRFWEESFFDAFRSKLTEDQVRVHKWHSDTEQAESLHARKQAAFATLSTFAMNMKEFGMDKKDIDRFVEKHAHLNDLEPEQVEMLRMMDSLRAGPVGEREDDGTTGAETADESANAAEKSNSEVELEEINGGGSTGGNGVNGSTAAAAAEDMP